MFENIKKRIAHFILKHKYLHKHKDVISYANIIRDSKLVLIVMPETDSDFTHAFEIPKYFTNDINKKTVTLFIPEHRYNSFPERDKYRYVSFYPKQMNSFYLPDKKLVDRLVNMNFDIVLDLNRNENVFYSAISNIVKSKTRVSFTKKYSEDYYNLQINDKNSTPEAAYKSFLNHLQMF